MKGKQLLSLIVVMMLLVVSCSNANDAPAAPERTELVLGELGEWWGLDTTQLDGSSFTQRLVADPIVLLDDSGSLIPCMASEVEMSEDGKTIRLRFPEGMKYADGRDLTPEDVVASLERGKTAGPFGTDLQPIVKMEVKDRDVFLYLEEYSANIANTLSSSFVTVMHKDDTLKPNDELLWNCMPYGMYSLDEYVEGSHVVLKRNPHFISHNPLAENKGPAAFEKITVRFFKEEFSLINAFNVDDVQFASGLSIDGSAQATGEFTLENTVMIPNIHYIELNQSDPILSDINVRKAIGLIINRQDVVEANKEAVIEAYSIVTENALNYSEEFNTYYKDTYANDIDQALKLLEEAGWKDTDNDGFLDKDGQKLTLQFLGAAQPTDERTAQALQLQFKEVGIDLTLELIDPNYRYEKIERGEFQIGMEQFGTEDPVLLLSLLFTNPDNRKAKDAYFDTVYASSLIPDYDERTKGFETAQRMLVDECVIIPMYTIKGITVWKGDLNKPLRLKGGDIIWNDLR